MRTIQRGGIDARCLCEIRIRPLSRLPQILRRRSAVDRNQPLTVSPVMEAATEADVSEANAPAKTKPRITPEASVGVKVTVAGIAEAKIKRPGVAIARIRI